MTETVDIRTQTRRVKAHILNRYLKLADKNDAGGELQRAEKELYNELTMTFARNVIPRSHEHGGDPENETPIPILTMNVSTHNSDSKDSQPSEANPRSTGRDLSE